MSAIRPLRDRAAKLALDAVATLTRRRTPSPGLRRTVGVFLFWGIGDAVLATPFLRALRTALPDAQIVLIGKPWLRDLLGEEKLADEFATLVPPWTRHSGKYRLWSSEWRDFARAARLAGRRFDLLISLRPDPRETALARVLSCAEFAGYAAAGGAGWISADLGETVTDEADTYRGELASLAAVQLFGARPPAEPRLTILPPPPALTRQLAAAGYRQGPVLAVAFGAAHPLRRWSADGITQTLALLRRRPGAYLVIESDDSPQFAVPGDTPSVRWRGPLAELRRVLAAADVAFCTDSGTMHIAAAVGCRTVSVFGPGSIARFAPRPPRHATYAVEPMPCRPCHDNCRYASPLCLDRIDVSTVAALLDDALAAAVTPRLAPADSLAV